jgi:Putative Actinobacterial Holin-X, holin superfamily III
MPSSLSNLPALASEAVAQAANLVQLEFRLARTEMKEKAIAWRNGTVFGVVGAMFGAVALLLVVEACVAVLVQAGLSSAVATIIVAAACAVIALVLFQMSRKRLNFEELAPRRTIAEINRDKDMMKEKLT